MRDKMAKHYEIRADYNAESIIVYQAYAANIALPALETQRFVAPFSFNRMTWIKPSFLWLMERSNWGQKSGQEHILAIRIKRTGWDEALTLGVLTHPEKTLYTNAEIWQAEFDKAHVHIQWDPERSIRGATLPYDSIQVGLSRHIIQRYVDEWMVAIEDYTPLVRKIHSFLKNGDTEKAKKFLPKERIYPIDPGIGKHILIG
jgi:hypothetical protein